MSGCAFKITFDKSYSLQDKIEYLERHILSFKQAVEKEEIKGDLVERDAWLKHHARYSKKHKELMKLKLSEVK
jgi:hypothetical protein